MTDSGDEKSEALPEENDETPDESSDEKDFDPRDDTYDDSSESEKEEFDPRDDSLDDPTEKEEFDPRDDSLDDPTEKEEFDPRDDSLDDPIEKEEFDPRDDSVDDPSEEAESDPRDESLDDPPEKEEIDPQEILPDNPPEKEDFNPHEELPEENYNPSGSEQISILVPESSEENPDQEQENPEKEQETEKEIDENDLELAGPEGEPSPPVESEEIRELIFEAEELEAEFFPEHPAEDPEIEAESETEKENQEQEQDQESEPEDIKVITPEGEVVENPQEVSPDLIPLRDAIEQLYEEQQSQGEKSEDEQQETEGKESEPESKEKSEVKSEQTPAFVPEQNSKPLKLKGNQLKPMTDKEKLDQGRQYDIKYIARLYERYLGQKQFKKPEKKVKKQEQKKPKPQKYRPDQLEIIDPEYNIPNYRKIELERSRKKDVERLRKIEEQKKAGNEGKHLPATKPTIIEKFDENIEPEESEKTEVISGSEASEKIEEKQESEQESIEQAQPKAQLTAKKKQQRKSKTPKYRPDQLEFIDPEYKKIDYRKIELEKSRKKDIERLKKIEEQEKAKKKGKHAPATIPTIIEKLDEITVPDEPEKTKKKQEVNEAEKSVEKQESKQEQPEQAKPNTQTIPKKDQQQKPKSKEEQKKLELEWLLLLQKWIQTANIPAKSKEKLLKILEKYQSCRELFLKLTNGVDANTIKKELYDIIQQLINQFEQISETEKKIFLHFNTFRSMYQAYPRSDLQELLKEQEKFLNFLVKRLSEIKKSWKALLIENLHLSTTLSLQQKALIAKIIQHEKLSNDDKEELVELLKKLPTEELVALLGYDFKRHTEHYLKWGWDFYEHVKEAMLTSYFNSPSQQNRITFNHILSQDGKRYLPLAVKNESWTGKKTSFYYSKFSKFIKLLVSVLIHHKVAENIKEIEKILQLREGLTLRGLGNELSENNLDGSHKTGTSKVIFNKDEDSLDKWLVRILIEIEFSSSIVNKAEAVKKIIELFEEYYRISGYEYVHPLYRKARLTLFRLGEVLVKAGVITENSLSKLNKLLKSRRRCFNFYRNLKENPYAVPKEITAKKLIADLIKNAKEEATLTRIQEEQMKEIMVKYLRELVMYRDIQDKLKNYDYTYRKELIDTLLAKCEAFRKVMAKSMTDFCELLFGKRWTSLTEGFLKDDSRPHLDKIFQIICNSNEWTIKQFKDVGVNITSKDLDFTRKAVKKEVISWIIKARYNPPLLHENLHRTDNIVAPELILLYYLWLAAALNQNNPQISFKQIFEKKIYPHNAQLTWNTREGYHFAENTIKKIQKTIKTWIGQESQKSNKNLKKIEAYKTALKVIALYAQIIGLDLKGGISTKTSTNYRGDFDKEQVKIYHVILGLGRHLGFDPIFFTPIEDQMFDMNKKMKEKYKQLLLKIYIYIRHHFLNNPDRTSIELLEQIITDTRYHTFWEKIVSEDEALIAIKVLEDLIKYKEDIDESDICREFKKHGTQYLWIAENWIAQSKFRENLQLFNDRKNDIKTLPLDKFIKEHFLLVYKKFIIKLLKRRLVSVRKVIEKLHPAIDVSKILNLDKEDDYIKPYMKIFAEILKKMGFPIKF